MNHPHITPHRGREGFFTFIGIILLLLSVGFAIQQITFYFN